VLRISVMARKFLPGYARHATERVDWANVPMAAAPGYQFPPLWGPDSFNNGAGMSRLLTAAAYAMHNMPIGTTYSAPVLADEQAYDVVCHWFSCSTSAAVSIIGIRSLPTGSAEIAP
jgi:hypothetical protein